MDHSDIDPLFQSFLLFAPDRAFVAPYIERELPKWHIYIAERPSDFIDTNRHFDFAIMLSGTEVYDATVGDLLDESTPVNGNHPLRKDELAFTDFCRNRSIPSCILRCANIIGTGMTGYPRQLAESIYRGTFFHFPDNDARISVVHAADIAAVVKALVASDSSLNISPDSPYNLTDGTNPTLHDLAEALAHRMKSKRISNLSTFGQRWLAKAIYGHRRYTKYTSTLTFDGSTIRTLLRLQPIAVTDYLTTHCYDENSL